VGVSIRKPSLQKKGRARRAIGTALSEEVRDQINGVYKVT